LVGRSGGGLGQLNQLLSVTALETRTLFSCSQNYTKPSTSVKYVIKLVGAENPITNSKFVEQYVTNNKANQIFS